MSNAVHRLKAGLIHRLRRFTTPQYPFGYNEAMESHDPKPLYWLASSKRDLLELPDPVMDDFGYALYLAQIGKKHERAKPLHGFGSAGILEIVEDWQGSTYRAVYTVRFEQAVFVLHVFQKKAKRGSETPSGDMEVVRQRFRLAQLLAKELGL
jgi:phage-related protein